MDRRNTIQRSLVLESVRKHGHHATADEIYAMIEKEHPLVSRATVYRNLNVLSEEGLIRKIEIPEAADRFDHNCSEHYHARCVVCNRIADVDMDVVPELTEKIRDTGGMELIGFDIVFKAVCPECKKKKEGETER